MTTAPVAQPTKRTYLRLLAARILSEANDLKRTPDMLAGELGVPIDELKRLLSGEAQASELLDLVDRIGASYPVDAADLRLIEDDCDQGIRVVRATESLASSRIAERRDPAGGVSPYYEYRDTAFSRLAPFRPEWIRPLRVVGGPEPDDAAVVYNKGHLLHQYTFYVGAVNFYWSVDGVRAGQEMVTGDSSYGTPWWPHTFTALDEARAGYILAVTFGGQVRRAQRELYVLGRRTHKFIIDYRHHRRGLIDLLERHLANELMTRREFIDRCHAVGVDAAESMFDETHEPTAAEMAAAAAILGVEPGDLVMPRPEPEVVLDRRRDSVPSQWPASAPRYRVWRMARMHRMPEMKGFGVDVLSSDAAESPSLVCALHSWVYNYGAAPVDMVWDDGTGRRRTELMPGDSVYIQPFVAHEFIRTADDGRLCLVRVPGAVDLGAQRELSYMSEVDRVFFEDRVWF
jgi:hypothetical protein